MKTKILILLVFITTLYSNAQTGVLTTVDRLKVRTPQELPNNTQIITRGTTTGETGYVLKTDLQDVLKYATASALPVTGELGKLYFTIDDKKYYDWNGVIYSLIPQDANVVHKTGNETIDGVKSFKKSIKIDSDEPLDAKYLNGKVAYASLAEANTLIPIGIRSPYLTIVVQGVEYWWKDGEWVIYKPTPSLQTVLNVGNESTTNIIVQTTDTIPIETYSENNIGIYGSSNYSIGVLGNSGESVGVQGYSLNNIGSVFNIGPSNTNNITEWRRADQKVASISYDGKFTAKKSIKIDSDEPLDAKYLNGKVAYASLAEANTLIPIGIRSPYLTIVVQGVEYWWKDGEWQIKDLVSISDITALIAYSGASTTLVVKDAQRGGVFNYDSTSTTVDNGITFIATGKGAGRWIRDISNAQGSHVNWYGAKGDWNMLTNTGTDNAVAIQACINSRPNRNTCVVFGYGVYGSSTEIQLGEGTYLKGMSTLFPYQQFGDGSIRIDYTNMTAVKFYNNTHGFVTTLDVVSYRSQGIKIEGLGIFGSGKANGKTGLLLRQTANSTFPVKTTGLVSTNLVYLSEWTIGADGTNSTDSWYVNNSHFSECKTGLIGGGGQTFLNFTDFFRIDDYGFILNSASDPDIVNGCEVETRFCSQAAALINGRAIITATQFLTNKKSIIFSATANTSIVSNNHFHINSDTAITLLSGANDIQISGNNFHADYSGTIYNYDYVIEPLNVASNFISTSGNRVQINGNYFRKQNSLYTGNPVLIDNSTVSAIGNTFSGFTFTNEKQFIYTGTNVKLDNYNIANIETVGNSVIGGNNTVAGNSAISGNNTVTGKISAGVGAGSSLSGISSTGNTEDGAAVSSEGYGAIPTLVTRRAGGTFASPANTLNADAIGQWKAQGYFGGFVTRASLDFSATENWTSTAKGTGASIYVTPDGLNGRIPLTNTTGKGTSFGPNTTRKATAYIHLEPGTATANTAPLKLTTGVDLTTPEQGAVEFSGGRLKFTPSTVRQTLAFTSELPIKGAVATTGTSTTTFTVTIGATQANSTYAIAVTPTNALSASQFYVTNKTTTTFDVVYLTALTGAVAFDWILEP